MFLLGCTNTPVSSAPTESSSNASGSSTSSSANSSSLYWISVDGNGLHYINGYLGNEENIVIPSTINGVTIDVLNNFVFSGHSNLKSVTIPASITSIRENVFEGCTSLTSVIFQGPVTFIGGSAFKDCTSLASVTLPNSVSVLGANLFEGCTSLTSFTLPSSLNYLNNYVFLGCSRLTSIAINASNTLFSTVDGVLFNKKQTSLLTFPSGKTGSYEVPSSVTLIQDGAFFQCSLSSLVLPVNLSYIQNAAFQGCSHLSSLSLDPQNANYTVANNVLFSKDQTTLVAYLGGLSGTYSIPSSVTDIGTAFFNCSEITGVILPTGLVTFSASAFYGCSKLSSIEVNSENSSWASSSGALYSKDLSKLILVPEDMAGSFSVPSGTKTIANGAFHSCSRLTEVVLPSTLVKIGSGLFYGCSSLTSVSGFSNLSYVESYTFYGCSSLASITFSVNLTAILEYAFYGCSSLTTFSLGNKFSSFGKACFMNCSSLLSIEIPSGCHTIPQYAFYGCSKLSSIVIDDYVSSFGEFCFGQCSSLSSLILPETVIESFATVQPTVAFMEGAFAYCTNLVSIVLPSTTTLIGSRTFANDSLLSIYFSASSFDAVTLNFDWNVFSGKGYLYSENQPTSMGDYWHYINGYPVAW